MIRVLFVDDEQAVLDCLQNRLRRMRRKWSMSFALGADRALALMSEQPVDVVVTEMWMAGMSGAELLHHVPEHHPHVVRIVLSGQTSQDRVLAALPHAHWLLSKPCDADVLERAIDGVRSIHAAIADERVKRLVGGVVDIPSLPALYLELTALVEREDVSLQEVGRVVERDIAMTGQVLHLVNTAYYGLSRKIHTATEAVTYLGSDAVRALVLTVGLFRAFARREAVDGFSLDQLQTHSLRTAHVASALLDDPEDASTAYSAALLHDLGNLVLATNAEGMCRATTMSAEATGQAFVASERTVHGFGHAEVGAALLELWGLPESMVEGGVVPSPPASKLERDVWGRGCGPCRRSARARSRGIPRAESAAADRGRSRVCGVRGADASSRRVASPGSGDGCMKKSKQEPKKPMVLCVDDEPGVLEGLELHLRRRFRVRTAPGGAEGLRILAEEPECCVIVSDMRMPNMNGAEFLTLARDAAPEATRLLLTGQTDIESAVAAINEGQIFRFLTKPCPPEQLLSVFDSAMEQHRLVNAERELLEKTVYGSVKALTGVLGLTRPLSFGRSMRLPQYVAEMCNEVGYEPRWAVEIAAMVMQLGSVALPEAVAEKVYYGRELSHAEQVLVDQCPDAVRALLGNIPRLEPVMSILDAMQSELDKLPAGLRRPARILQVAMEFDLLIARGMSAADAISALRGRGKAVSQKLVEALALHHGADEMRDVFELPIASVREGMIFAEDVRTTNGVLLVARGFEITAAFVAKARAFGRGYIVEPMRVLGRGQPATTRAAG